MNNPNLVKLSDGSMADRAEVCFSMRKLSSNPDIEYDMNGRMYQRDEKGTLRRIKDRDTIKMLVKAEHLYLEVKAKEKEYAEGIK